MTDAKAHRIATDVHNCVRDEIVQAIDAVDAIPCDRCNPVKREQPQSLMRRIGMVHG